jgi:D-erythronate 2-dehydrogenase
MNVLVTGANGFIGRALVERLLGSEIMGQRVTTLTAVDRTLSAVPRDPRIRAIVGDLTDLTVLNKATSGQIDLVFHLASVPGGTAAKNFKLGLRGNLQATIMLLELLRQEGRKPTVVFASTIGVYGTPMPTSIDEETLPAPAMSYGAHKLIGEILISDYSARGFIDGRSLRLPGIVARPPEASGLMSAFMSDLIRELSEGREFTCPVSAEGVAWWMSRPCVVDNLLTAANLPSTAVASRRVWLLPVLRASMADVVAAIAVNRGSAVSKKVSYQRNVQLEAQFGSLPPLHCPQSEAIGFQNDRSLERLVELSLEGP